MKHRLETAFMFLIIGVSLFIIAFNVSGRLTEQSTQIATLQSNITTLQQTEPVKVVQPERDNLVERFEQTVRENVVLRQEVASQAHQLDLYEGGD